MMILTLLGLIVVVLFLLVRLTTGTNLVTAVWKRVRPVHDNKVERLKQFTEETVEKMLKDERVVQAVYARSQSYDGAVIYILTVLPFFLSLTTIEPEGVPTWYQGLMRLIFFVLSLVGLYAMGRIDDRIDQYRAIIDLYEARLGIPKRP